MDKVCDIRIYHECEGRREHSIPRIFLSHPHTNNGFFCLLTIKYLNGFQMFLNTLRCDISQFNITMTSLVFRYAAVRFLSLARVGMEYVR